ncbi:MAG TPA: hypothetical protein PKW95_01790 [bacterium]|nr:hypothetical protein [bacterium]
MKKIVLLSLVVALATVTAAHAQQAPDYEFLLNYRLLNVEQWWDNDGSRSDFGYDEQFVNHRLALDSSLRLIDRLDVLLGLEYDYLTATFHDEDWTSAGLGDIKAGLRTWIIHEPLGVGVQATFLAPYAYESIDTECPIGDGVPAYDLRLVLHRQFVHMPAYVNLEGGYRIREGQYTEQWRYRADAGFAYGMGFLNVALFGHAAATGTDHAEDWRNPMVRYSSALGEVEPSIGLRSLDDRFRVSFGYALAVWGRGIGAGDTFSVAVQARF